VELSDRTRANWHLKFRDEFSGNALDRKKWSTTFPWGARTIASNDELEYYADDAFKVAHGILRIRADRRRVGKFTYTSGMITSYASFDSTYGYYEIRAKVPKGKGLWPAFWLVPQDQSSPPEIDVLEILGNKTKTIVMTNHYMDVSGVTQSSARSWTGPDFSQGFHTFGIEWRPGRIVWYVDGAARFQTTTGIPSKPMYVIADLAVGGVLPGTPDATTRFPSYLDIDYIRIYQRT
jgi:beta-glucanase (GH16 family)